MYCKREVLLSVLCALSMELALGSTDSKGVDEHPAVNTIRNKHSRRYLDRMKRGWIGGDDPGNRATESWTTTTTPPETPPPPRPDDTAETTHPTTTEPPMPGSSKNTKTTMKTTKTTMKITKTTMTTIKTTAYKPTSKITMLTTKVPPNTSDPGSSSTTVYGHVLPVVVALLVFTLYTSTNCLDL